jgi:ketosteroid isomerase-like protein
LLDNIGGLENYAAANVVAKTTYIHEEMPMKVGMFGAAAAALGLLVSIGLAGSSTAWGHDGDREIPSKKLPYPDVTDASHATDRVEDIFEGFFSAKSLHDGNTMMTFWAQDPILYIDATSGGIWPTYAALKAVWTGPFFANAPPSGLSYPLRIIGDSHSALVEFVDTPTLLGAELRILGSVTFDHHGKIVRWIDYWDARSALRKTTIGPSYPTDFHDTVENTSPEIKNVVQALQTAFAAGDAATATALFTPDAVFEDMGLHTRVEGQLQIQRYLTRGLSLLPYGVGASVAHVVGGRQGGGYEWHAALSGSPLKRGNTAIELDDNGKITRFTTIWDTSQVADPTYHTLVLLAAEQ